MKSQIRLTSPNEPTIVQPGDAFVQDTFLVKQFSAREFFLIMHNNQMIE